MGPHRYQPNRPRSRSSPIRGSQPRGSFPTLNKNQRDTLASCLTQVFGRVEDDFVDAAIPLLKWIELAGGETLFREGDPENGVYFVINGRLRALQKDGDQLRAINEVARGETVGEMAVLSGEPRSATVVAIRDTVLAHASYQAFEELWRRHPELPVHMARIIIDRLARFSEKPPARRPASFCLLAITEGVDVVDFGKKLVGELDRWGVATLETSTGIDERFGEGAAQGAHEDEELRQKVSMWLDDAEFWNQYVIFATDDRDSEWTRRCLRGADEILLVARADAPVRLHEIEEKFCMGEGAITGARQTLVLLHGQDREHPKNTTAWLDRRPIDMHFHLRPAEPQHIARLARIVSGNAIGLALGGGGARGFAHLGVYRALEEAGISIDFVSGTSIGAVMAAYISMGLPASDLIESARKAFAQNPTGDLNFLPLVSLVKGRRLRKTVERAVAETVGSDADVADSWKTLICIATNFSLASEVMIERGPLSRAVRASVSIPVALPPVPWDGDLLVDGGVFNNFPTDVLETRGVRQIIGVDLTHTKSRIYEHEEIPGTWRLLLDRLRKRRRYRLPSLSSILMNTTILYSESRREEARKAADLYFNPEFGRIGLLEWKAFDRIVEIGYQHAREVLSKMTDEEIAAFRGT